jgi:16S rRNA (adenine(1408)-N(1))-methyltransferase
MTDTFVVGLDPATDALAHAARRVVRERVPNLLLLVADVETASHDLAGLADEVHIHFPWGSLLRGVLAEDESALDAIARLPKEGGTLTVLVSLVLRDGAEAPLRVSDVHRLAGRYAERDLVLVETRSITEEDVRAATSTWGKRLGAGASRQGIYARFVRRRAAGRAFVGDPDREALEGERDDARAQGTSAGSSSRSIGSNTLM